MLTKSVPPSFEKALDLATQIKAAAAEAQRLSEELAKLMCECRYPDRLLEQAKEFAAATAAAVEEAQGILSEAKGCDVEVTLHYTAYADWYSGTIRGSGRNLSEGSRFTLAALVAWAEACATEYGGRITRVTDEAIS